MGATAAVAAVESFSPLVWQQSVNHLILRGGFAAVQGFRWRTADGPRRVLKVGRGLFAAIPYYYKPKCSGCVLVV